MGEAEAPSLISLCLEAIKKEFVYGDDLLPDVYELPSNLFDMLVMRLHPLALEKLQRDMPFEDSHDDEFSDECFSNGRKRRRIGIFDKAWKILFKLRWPEIVDQIGPVVWHQIYWERHLQNCLDRAAESAVLPSFDKCIRQIEIPDSILKNIGYEVQISRSTCDYSKLASHCEQFGLYARYLRLQNVLCTPEICHLLRNSRLQSLVLCWIRSKEHVEGLCKLLNQNAETLSSVEFMHCKFSPVFLDSICVSLNTKSMQAHRIEHFSMKSSRFLEANLMTLPHELVSFLSSGRSFRSLTFHDTHLNQRSAKIIFNTLLDASPQLSILELSENNMAGWLSDFNTRYSSSCFSSGINRTFQSLHVLNLRGNNMNEDDMVSLRHAMVHMPNLESLNISDNPIGDDGLRILVSYFREASESRHSHSLVNLDVENCELSSDGVTSLLETLSMLKTPWNSISIAENSLSREIAPALANFLGGSLRVLNIGGIGLGSAGFREFQEGLGQGLNLVEINISKNRGGLEAAMFLSRLILLAPELIAVNAAYNLMPIESLTIICSALKKTKGNLRQLDLTGNNWDFQPSHASMLAEVQNNGKPILSLSSSFDMCTSYDDDP